MIDWIWLTFLIIALVFMFIIIFQSKNIGFYWTTTLSIFTIILFYVCSAGVMELEVPYQYWNTSTTSVETGYHSLITIENIYFSYFFWGLAILVFVNWIAYIFEYISEWMKKNRMNP